MSIFNQQRAISDEFLKRHKFGKGVWGKPDSYVGQGKYKRPKAVWKENQYMWELYQDDYYIYYFPHNFEGYVNINRKEIQDHKGWMCAQKLNDSYDHGWICIKVEDELDFEIAMNQIKQQIESEDVL